MYIYCEGIVEDLMQCRCLSDKLFVTLADQRTQRRHPRTSKCCLTARRLSAPTKPCSGTVTNVAAESSSYHPPSGDEASLAAASPQPTSSEARDVYMAGGFPPSPSPLFISAPPSPIHEPDHTTVVFRPNPHPAYARYDGPGAGEGVVVDVDLHFRNPFWQNVHPLNRHITFCFSGDGNIRTTRTDPHDEPVPTRPSYILDCGEIGLWLDDDHDECPPRQTLTLTQGLVQIPTAHCSYMAIIIALLICLL
ncbi:hypothetical protein F66182_4768, partial [Fusarium sp. NRRL 66182]